MELQVDTMVKISKWVDTEKGKCSEGYIRLFKKRRNVTIYIK